MTTAKVCTDPVSQLLRGEQSGGFDHVALAVHPMRFNAIEPRAFAGQVTGHDTHPLPRLAHRSVVRPHPLAHFFANVQEALSQIISNAFLPSFSSFSQHQAKYCVVTALSGRSSTKRSQTCSGKRSGAAGQETNRP